MSVKDYRKNFEKKFHDDYVMHDKGVRTSQNLFYSRQIESYEYDNVFSSFGNMAGKRLLFYGCGGHFSMIKEFIERGSSVVAIDISPATIKKLSAKIDKENLTNKCIVLEMDCESLDFDPGTFDLVFGRSIIHHLNIEKSLEQIYSVMKTGAKALFVEPLATNPVINLYRKLTPQDRTPYEHPFVSSDIILFKNKFGKISCQYLYALTLLSFIIRFISNKEHTFIKAFDLLSKLDNLFLCLIPFYKLLCWDVIICCQKQ